MQRAAVVHPRWHDRQFILCQFNTESVFFEDAGIAPAFRAIELGDQISLALYPNLVDAVFIAVERQQSSVAEIAE